jgi:transcriptional regulator with XRE-family HTH domain
MKTKEIALNGEKVAAEIGGRLRSIRVYRRLPVNYMAEILEIAPDQYTKLEEGKKLLGAYEAFILNKVLGIDINWLIAGDNDNDGKLIPMMRVIKCDYN